MTAEVQSAADIIDKWAAKLVAVAEQHGPQAVELALAVGRIGAAQVLASGAASLAVCAAGSFGAFTLLKAHRAKKAIHDGYYKRDYPEETSTREEARAAEGPMFFYGVGSGVTGLIAAGAFIGAVGRLSDLYAWAGLWRPEIYLAAKALGL